MKTLVLSIVFFVAVTLWTTSRHEASHAAMAVVQGATIDEMTLLPGVHPELGFYFAYVSHSEETTWLTDAAPYFADIVLAVIAFLWAQKLKSGAVLRRAVVLFGLVSPLVDLLYNYQGGLWRAGTDVWDLLQVLPGVAVHGYFLISIVGIVFALATLRRERVRSAV